MSLNETARSGDMTALDFGGGGGTPNSVHQSDDTDELGDWGSSSMEGVCGGVTGGVVDILPTWSWFEREVGEWLFSTCSSSGDCTESGKLS